MPICRPCNTHAEHPIKPLQDEGSQRQEPVQPENDTDQQHKKGPDGQSHIRPQCLGAQGNHRQHEESAHDDEVLQTMIERHKDGLAAPNFSQRCMKYIQARSPRRAGKMVETSICQATTREAPGSEA